MDFTPARKIADAILYEGYLLYPYRASAQKNRLRWQFGVLAPRAYSEQGATDPWAMQSECLIELDDGATLHLKLRFLQAQARDVEQSADHEGKLFSPVDSFEIDGSNLVSWEEGVEREVQAAVDLTAIFARAEEIGFQFAANTEQEIIHSSEGKIAARIVRQRWPISGRIVISASRLNGFSSLTKLRMRVENLQPPDREWQLRQEALRQSLISTHLLLGIEQGKFVSLLEPPEWAAAAVSLCENLHTWPVLVGDKENRNLMLAAPIILYDYPQIAPESSGDSFDSTEIDELLALRTITLTDDEKRAARATDERGAILLDRIENMPPEIFERLHGTMRDRRSASKVEEAAVWVDDVRIDPGNKVRLRPRLRADAQDMFLDGRMAIVDRIVRDVEGRNYIAVTLVDDPAADLHQWRGRFYYFYPDEIDPAVEPDKAPLDHPLKESS